MLISKPRGLLDKYRPLLLGIFFFCFSTVKAQTYNPSNFTVSNKAYGPAQAVTTDARSQFYDATNFVMRDYNGTTEVLSYLNLPKYRWGHFPIYVHAGGILQSNGVWLGGATTVYFFKDSTGDANLVRWYTDSTGLPGGPFFAVANHLSEGNAGLIKGTLSLDNVDNTSDATKNAATVSLTNHTIDANNNTLLHIPNSALTNNSIGLTLNNTGATPTVTTTPAALGTSIVLSIPYGGPGDSGFLRGTDWAFFHGKLDSVHISNDSVYNCVNGTCTLQSVITAGGAVNSVNGTNGSVLCSPTTGNVLCQVGTPFNFTWTGQHTFSSFAPIFSTLTTNGGVFYGNGSGQLLQTGAGTSGQIFESQGGSAPVFFTPNAATVEGWLGFTPLSNALGSTHLFVGNGSNVATDVAVTGDATVSNTGVWTNTGLKGSQIGTLAPGALSWTGSGWTFVPNVFYVGFYGAVADEVDLYDGAMTAASHTLTSSSATFVLADVGKHVSVTGAGGGGSRLVTTISAFTDAHHVNLTAAAVLTVATQHIRYGTDNTTSIQNAIAAAAANGGTVYFGPGSYLVAGPLVHTDNVGGDPNSQLFIPITDPGFVGIDSFPKQIIFQGIADNSVTDGGLATLNNGNSIINHGSILVSDLDSIAAGNDTASMIATAFVNGASIGFATINSNSCAAKFKDLTLKVRHNGTRGAVIGGISMGWDLNPDFEDITVTIDTALTNSVQPTNHITGITGMYNNQGNTSYFKNCQSNGFYYGYKWGEHTVAINNTAFVNFIGMGLMTNTHAISIYSPSTDWNVHNFSPIADKSVGVGNVKANITNWRLEDFRTGGKWYQNIDDIKDDGSHLAATITFLKYLSSNPNPVNTLDISNGSLGFGGQGITATPLDIKSNAIEIFAPPGTPYPGALAINFNPLGSNPRVGAMAYLTSNEATSSDTAYAAFVGATQQSGANHAIGYFAMLNTSLGTDNRAYLKGIFTGAAANTSFANEYFLNGGTLTLNNTVSGTLFTHFTPVNFTGPTTTTPSANLPAGTWETSPADGDVGHVSGKLWFHDGSTDYDLLHPSTIRYQHTIFTPLTGGTVNLVNNQYNIVNPAGAIATLTVNLPSSPANNDVVYIKYTQAVTAVTYANGTVADGITAPTAGGLVVLTFDTGTSTWY